MPRSNSNVLVVNIGTWDGVLRLKFRSCTFAIAHAAPFRNIEADAALSKYAVVFCGSGGSLSVQLGGSSSLIVALNALYLFNDSPTGPHRQLVPFSLAFSCAFLASTLFFCSAFSGSSKQLDGTCVVDLPQVLHSCLLTKYHLPQRCNTAGHEMPALLST